MTTLARTATARARQRGVGLLETLVGLLIGFIVILVVYNVLAVAEGYRRATIGASDAQVTGLLTQFVAGRDVGNGGAGITDSGSDLIKCTKNEAGALLSALPVTQLDVAARPIPLLITTNLLPLSDSFISLTTGAPHVMWPVDFVAPFPAPGAAISVQSPNGFTSPVPTAAVPYWAVVITNEVGINANKCKVIRVTNSLPDPTVPATGKVTLTQDPALATTIPYTAGGPARMLNLGPVGMATRIQYDVDDVNHVLRTTELLTTAALVTNPVAQNVVLMKAQYGIDNNADGVVDFWTPADNSSGTDFSPAGVRAMNLAQLNQILAVRIGVVVRGDEPDLKLLTDPTNQDLKDQARGILALTRPPVVLFNCSANTNAACPNRVVVPMGGGLPLGAANCLPSVICDYWRYRTYETIIPLRNAIFAATLPP